MTATVDHAAAGRLCGCSLTDELLEWSAVSVNERVRPVAATVAGARMGSVTVTAETLRAALRGVEPPGLSSGAAGEPVFAEPWEGRAYALAIEAVDRLGLEWQQFRHRLIAAIADAPERPYYASWVVALERLMLEAGTTTEHELRIERAEAAAYRYHDGGVENEVTPIAGAAPHPGSEQTAAAHVELYRRFAEGAAVSWGRRAFDADGALVADDPMGSAEWVGLRDRLLSFQPAKPG